MRAAVLDDRGAVRVSGADATPFLQGLLTADVAALRPGAASLAALLTPQGKILFDCLAIAVDEADGGGFLLDCSRALAPDLARRLSFYKLRSAVTVEDLSERLAILAVWEGSPPPEPGFPYADPRLPALGHRVALPAAEAPAYATAIGAEPASPEDWQAHRISLGIPEGGKDFAYGDTFPHEADMDQLGGISFAKGCYVGQEVVSRMEHRGTARSRIVPVAIDGFRPEAGVEVLAGDRPIGRMGSAVPGRGLALIRLDRLADALAEGRPIMAGGVPIRPLQPPWAQFSVPGSEERMANG